jgi:uncharacterized membrane protein YgcG
MFLGDGGGGPGLSSRPYAESTQAVIDQEVGRLVREAEQRAVTLIRTHQGDLTRLADLLVDKETVDGDEVYRLLGLPVPQHAPDGLEIAPGRAAAGPPVPSPAAVPDGEGTGGGGSGVGGSGGGGSGGGGPAGERTGSGVPARGVHRTVPAPGDQSRPSTRGPNSQG